MRNVRLGSLLLACLAIGTKGSHLQCYECEGGKESACATGDITGLTSVECESDRCTTATNALLKRTSRSCLSGNRKLWDCVMTTFGKDGCVDIGSEATKEDPAFVDCMQEGQEKRKKRMASDYDTYCFCESDYCNSGRNLGGNVVILLFGIWILLALAFG